MGFRNLSGCKGKSRSAGGLLQFDHWSGGCFVLQSISEDPFPGIIQAGEVLGLHLSAVNRLPRRTRQNSLRPFETLTTPIPEARLAILALFTPEFSHYLVTSVNHRVNRMAHNLKVVGSNPTPATNLKPRQLRKLSGLFADI